MRGLWGVFGEGVLQEDLMVIKMVMMTMPGGGRVGHNKSTVLEILGRIILVLSSSSPSSLCKPHSKQRPSKRGSEKFEF